MTAFCRCALFLFLPLLSLRAEPPSTPNVMIFLVDDMGIMDTSVSFLTNGAGEPTPYPLNDFYRTPSMERLAAQGIRFNQFYAMSVCSPTRISLMTGQNAARHRATNWINPWENNAGEYGPADWDWEGLGPDDVTLAHEFQRHGYQTIHVGKGHFGPENTPGEDPSHLGFTVNIGGAAFGAPGSYYAQDNYRRASRPDRPSAVPHLDDYHGSEVYLTEALTLEAKKVVTQAVEAEQPFFLYFSHYAVHAPFQADPRFAAHYKDSGKPKNAQAFATLIEGMDKSLGDMLDHFDALDVAENTLVLFLGDNGTDAPLGHQHEVACAAPLRGKKGSHYEGGMRIPFIAAWAKAHPEQPWQTKAAIPAGQLQSQVANVTDLFPSLLDLLGWTTPTGHAVDGHSLSTLWSGNRDDSRPEQFLMHYPHGLHRSNYFTAWRDGEWKLIHHTHPEIPAKGNSVQSEGKTHQLFHLANDPFEQNDLSESHPEVVQRLQQGMDAALTSMDALSATKMGAGS